VALRHRRSGYGIGVLLESSNQELLCVALWRQGSYVHYESLPMHSFRAQGCLASRLAFDRVGDISGRWLAAQSPIGGTCKSTPRSMWQQRSAMLGGLRGKSQGAGITHRLEPNRMSHVEASCRAVSEVIMFARKKRISKERLPTLPRLGVVILPFRV
jgi:hypothetical protein